jgi:hypothetical protein
MRRPATYESEYDERRAIVAALAVLEDLTYRRPPRTHRAALHGAMRLLALELVRLSEVSAKNSTCERVVHGMPLDTEEWAARRVEIGRYRSEVQ